MGAYVYYSYEEHGRGYIGARNRDSVGDVYFGTFSDPTFNPTEKVVIAEFETFEEALAAEIKLHHFFDVATNPHFANRARQTSTGWSTAGTTQPESTNRKRSESLKGRTKDPQWVENVVKGKRKRKWKKELWDAVLELDKTQTRYKGFRGVLAQFPGSSLKVVRKMWQLQIEGVTWEQAVG